jgi:type II secretory pathway pseudopilin PulG
MNEEGLSLLELTTVCGIIGVLAAFSFPSFKAYSARARLTGATRVFSSEFRKAHSMAVRRGVYTAIRFERTEDGADFSVYADGNRNGDPIRFGRSEILSFSPIGTSTPGTFYLAGEGIQGAVRVTTNARVRLLVSYGGPWEQR